MEIMFQPHCFYHLFEWPRLIRVEPRDIGLQTSPLFVCIGVSRHSLLAAALNLSEERVSNTQ